MITRPGLLEIVLFLAVLLLLVKPLGWYMAEVYAGRGPRYFKENFPVERLLLRLCCINPEDEMDWKAYLSAMLVFNLLGVLLVYGIQRLQIYLPFNPQHFIAPSADLAFNTAVSFTTNTDWQAYSGETNMSYLTQMLAFTSQNFLSAATGMSLLVALARGFASHSSKVLGNFWVDTLRGVLYILLPLSVVLALVLVSLGVIQNLKPNVSLSAIETKSGYSEVIPMGPVASQVAITQLGTNGGGFFNTNASHPFANPTPVTNFLEMVALLLIPASLCVTFGLMVNDKRQGLSLLFAMVLMFLPMALIAVMLEQQGLPALEGMGVAMAPIDGLYPGGNMEGKEVRLGIVSSVLWSVATTSSGNGSVNSMLDSYTPLAGMIPLWMMHLGEVVFGGVGSGLYGMLLLVIITVFISGLMVGRTPEYLGKKIEPFEMKMATIAVLMMPMIVLLSTAFASRSEAFLGAILNHGPHGLTEIFYAFTSMANNNGSAFAGLNSNTPSYNYLGGLVMLIGRFWIAIPTLAIAGALVKKRVIPVSSGTLPTHTPLFIGLLICVTILLGALSFLPALALGPIVEQLTLWGSDGR